MMVTYSEKEIPIEQTTYTVYTNYAINGSSYLLDNQYLENAPIRTGEKEKTISIVRREGRKDDAIWIYPNPVKDRLTINLAEKYKDSYNITLRDLSSKIVKQKNYSPSRKLNLNTDSFNPGIYFIRLESADISFTQKIIIQ